MALTLLKLPVNTARTPISKAELSLHYPKPSQPLVNPLRTFTVTKLASSTGLTAVSKFKPRPPVQWAAGTHRKGPSRMEKVTSRMNWPIKNSTPIRIKI